MDSNIGRGGAAQDQTRARAADRERRRLLALDLSVIVDTDRERRFGLTIQDRQARRDRTGEVGHGNTSTGQRQVHRLVAVDRFTGGHRHRDFGAIRLAASRRAHRQIHRNRRYLLTNHDRTDLTVVHRRGEVDVDHVVGDGHRNTEDQRLVDVTAGLEQDVKVIQDRHVFDLHVEDPLTLHALEDLGEVQLDSVGARFDRDLVTERALTGFAAKPLGLEHRIVEDRLRPVAAIAILEGIPVEGVVVGSEVDTVLVK